MSQATARRRLADPDVRARLDEMRAHIAATVADRVSQLALRAVVILGEIMGDEHVTASTRVRAAEALLRGVPPLRDIGIVEDRLEAVEQALRRRESVRSSVHPLAPVS